MKHTIPEIGRGSQSQPSTDEILLGVIQARATFLEKAAIAHEKSYECKQSKNVLAEDCWSSAADQWEKCEKIARNHEDRINGR